MVETQLSLVCSKDSASADSSTSHLIGRSSLMLWAKAMYSASIVEHAISVCNLETHSIGAVLKVRTNHVLLLCSKGLESLHVPIFLQNLNPHSSPGSNNMQG
eukprot:11776858-Ditylum_brightwellii.AAC.1